jgi:hypothetical protein
MLSTCMPSREKYALCVVHEVPDLNRIAKSQPATEMFCSGMLAARVPRRVWRRGCRRRRTHARRQWVVPGHDSVHFDVETPDPFDSSIFRASTRGSPLPRADHRGPRARAEWDARFVADRFIPDLCLSVAAVLTSRVHTTFKRASGVNHPSSHNITDSR